MRLLPTLAAGTLLLAATASTAPALAHGGGADRNREVRTQLLAEDDTPLISGNVSHLGSNPGTVGISGCFLPTAPLFVTSGVESLTVWDVTDATSPTRVGVMPNALFENEAMNCGERRTADGTRRFALIGIDLVNVALDRNGISHTNGGGNELLLVDVTDPADPHVLSSVPATTSTHTVACVEATDCRYAYSAGDSGSSSFSVFDLRDLAHPTEVDGDAGHPRRPALPLADGRPQVELRRRRHRHPHRLRRLVDVGRRAAPQAGPAGDHRARPGRAPPRATTTSSTTTPSGPTPRASGPAPRPR